MSNRTKALKIAAVVVTTAVTTACLPAAAAAHPLPGVAPVAAELAPAPDCGVPVEGETVVILVPGTAHEPQPALTSRAEQQLAAAADSDAADGRGAKGAVAVLASTDGAPAEVLPLTPRRATCAVEHGLQRESLVRANIDRVRAAVAARVAHRSGLDLLAGIDNAVRGRPPGTLIVVSNGMSTEGGFAVQLVGWHADPDQLVEQLRRRGLLTNLAPGWRVLFTGLGETAGEQPALTKPARDTLVGYWMAICRAAVGTGSCEVDQTALTPQPPTATASMPVIPVEPVSSVIGPDGRTTVTVAGSVLFSGDSAELSPTAQAVLTSVTDKIEAKLTTEPGLTVVIRGYVADPPDSTEQGRQDTADARAQAVSEFLTAALRAHGRTVGLDTAGVGTPPGTTAIVNGLFSEAIAAQMRTVTITY